MTPPRIAIAMGDPAGIGPEVIVGAWGERLLEYGTPVVLGHPAILRRAVQLLRRPLEVVPVASIAAATPLPRVIPCLQAVSDDTVDTPAAAIDPRGGQAAYDAVNLAVDLALAGQVDAITTAPLNKAALWQAGHHYPGHTELLAERCGVSDFAMMLYLAPGPPLVGSAGLGVIHTTLHMALAEAIAALTPEEILRKTRLAHQALARLKSAAPRIAVCALNPHAGEEGLFGDEETRIIQPAVEAARAEGLDVTGPLPADTAMVRARDGAFDAVVAMYHDQGHIALKLLGMHRAVNVTLGLPIIRTSVAHGTAFDLAWRGCAETTGMIEAVRVAGQLAARRPGALSSTDKSPP